MTIYSTGQTSQASFMAASPLVLQAHKAETVEETVKEYWKQNGRIYVDKVCFDGCWHRIWRWLHLPTLKDHLVKHRVLTAPDDMYTITNDLLGPKEKADKLLQQMVPKAGRFAHYLLYMCICEDIKSNALGHGDAVKELESYAKFHCIKAPWDEDNESPQAAATPEDAKYSSSHGSTVPLRPPSNGQDAYRIPQEEQAVQQCIESDSPSPSYSQHRGTPVGLAQSPELSNAGMIVHTRKQIKSAVVEKQARSKERVFRELVCRTYQHLTKVVTDLNKFKVLVTQIPLSFGTRVEGDDLKAVQCAKNLMEVFTVLNQYWNFINYDLLEDVVVKYGAEDSKLQEDMEQYRNEMEEFDHETYLDQLVGVQLCNPRPNSCPVVARLPGNCSQRTLADVQLCRRCIAQGFGCDRSALRTSQVGTGSVLMTFLVPWSITGTMLVEARSTKMQRYLHSQGILQLTIGGMCVYGGESEDKLKLVSAGMKKLELKLELCKARQELSAALKDVEKHKRDVEQLRAEVEGIKEAHFYDLDAQQLLRNHQHLQLEIGNILETAEGGVQFWNLLLQEANLTEITELECLSNLSPGEKLITIVEQWSRASKVPVTVLMFCKVCWKAGVHLAAELLEEAAEVGSSDTCLSDEQAGWEDHDYCSQYELEFDQIRRFSEFADV